MASKRDSGLIQIRTRRSGPQDVRLNGRQGLSSLVSPSNRYELMFEASEGTVVLYDAGLRIWDTGGSTAIPREDAGRWQLRSLSKQRQQPPGSLGQRR